MRLRRNIKNCAINFYNFLKTALDWIAHWRISGTSRVLREKTKDALMVTSWSLAVAPLSTALKRMRGMKQRAGRLPIDLHRLKARPLRAKSGSES
jgi:hypothetical protein